MKCRSAVYLDIHRVMCLAENNKLTFEHFHQSFICKENKHFAHLPNTNHIHDVSMSKQPKFT